MEATLELVDLKNKYKLLRSQSMYYNDEARKYQEQRNILNRKVSQLLKEAKKEKQKRNELNQKVSQIKKEREKLRKDLDAKIQEFKTIDAQIKNIPKKNLISRLRKQIRQAEWTLQTKNLTPSEEKALIDRIDALESKLSQYKGINKIFQQRRELNAEIESLKAKMKILSDQIHKYSQESQVHHTRMVEILNSIDNEIKVKADEAHQKFLEAKSKADEFYSKSQTLVPRINEIMDELGEIQDVKNVKLEKVKEVVENRLDEAMKKFKAGKRLTLEEFTLLVKRGLI
ncbi:MAG: coiled-coil protein [Candidatus Helarchaeota archaeon]